MADEDVEGLEVDGAGVVTDVEDPPGAPALLLVLLHATPMVVSPATRIKAARQLTIGDVDFLRVVMTFTMRPVIGSR